MEFTRAEQNGAGAFCTTHWTIVLSAARPESRENQEAFARIYQDYWYPLYAYIRRRGYLPADAEDVTQNFFVRLIEKRSLAGLERVGGKFRSFLLRSLDNFLANEWDRAHAQKRGAGVLPLSLDAPIAEAKYSLEPPDAETPQTLFEKQWVLTLLANVLENLRTECVSTGKAALFGDLQPLLQGERQDQPYAEIASRHGMTEGALKVAVHRLRQRYGELLREEISRTVSSPEEVDDELRYLLAVSAS